MSTGSSATERADGGGRQPLRRRGPAAVRIAASLVLAATTSACVGTTDLQVEVVAPTTTPGASVTTQPPDCALSLPPAGQAAQLLLASVTSPDDAAPFVRSGRVGGFALRTTQSADVGEEITAAVAGAPLAPFVAADEEGGQGQAFEAATAELDAPGTLAEGTSTAAATAYGAHAALLAGLGVNMWFEPVADVGTGANRFGSDPARVGAFVGDIVPAISGAGVVPVVELWPAAAAGSSGSSGSGSGSGSQSRSAKLPTLDDIAELRTGALAPFDRAIAVGVPAIMVANAEVPGLTAEDEPASLSAAAVTGELRDRQGFRGVVLTEPLGSAGVVTEARTQGDAAVAALLAGADLAVLSGVDAVPVAYDRVLAAITAGELPQDRVLESLRRVLALKGIDGQCLDAVAAYSALGREDLTTGTTLPGTQSTGTSTTVAGAGTGTGSTTSRPTTTSPRSTTTAPRSTTTTPRSTTTTAG